MFSSFNACPGLLMTRFTRSFQIKCQATDTVMANNLPFSRMRVPLSDLNITRLQPRIKPQLRVGHCLYFFNHSSRVSFHITLCPCASHSNATCSHVSGASQKWHRPFSSIVSMCVQKSPTRNVLCIHFHKNSRVSLCRVVDRIEHQMVVSVGV